MPAAEGVLPDSGSLSSLQVMYFSSLFPYVVLACFLVRGLLLRGAVDGILHMFTPKVRVWGFCVLESIGRSTGLVNFMQLIN
jgi:spore maturation protein SpmB